MNNVKKSISTTLLLLGTLYVGACQDGAMQFPDGFNSFSDEHFNVVNAADKEEGGKDMRDLLEERDEFKKTEYFNEKRESVRYFLGQYKDFPDPVFDPNQPLKVPNQEDVEALFKYMRKYIDSLEAGGPDPEVLKRKLFIDENGKLHFDKLLDKFRYSPDFNDVSFSVEGLTFNRAKGVPGIKPVRYMSLFKNLILKDVKFDSVKLEDVDLSGSTLTNVTITDTNFSRALCMRCQFDNVNINDSTSKDADFSFSSGTLNVNDSNTSFMKITDSKFENLNFNNGSLRQSVFVNSGDVKVNNVETFSNLFDNTARSGKFKAIGLVYKNAFPGGTAYKILNKIRSADHIPVRIEYGLEKFVDENALQAEIIDLFSSFGTAESEGSIAQNALNAFRGNKDKYPEFAKMDKMLGSYVDKLDGLVIPGGLDVEPYWYDRSISAEGFYGDVRARLRGKKNIDAEKFPIRSVMEFLLIEHAMKQKIPLLLICRGAHIYNIFKNGRMIENLPDIYDNVDFENHLRHISIAPDLSSEDLDHRIVQLFNKSGRELNAVYGNHHQAIDLTKAGDGLKTLLVWNLPGKTYIPYALFDETYKSGAWLFQFHPEVKEEMGAAMSRQLANLNSEIYDSFFELVAKDTTKQTAPTPTKVDEPVATDQPSEQPEKMDAPGKTTAQIPQTEVQPVDVTKPQTEVQPIDVAKPLTEVQPIDVTRPQDAGRPAGDDRPIEGVDPKDNVQQGSQPMPVQAQPRYGYGMMQPWLGSGWMSPVFWPAGFWIIPQLGG